MNCGSNDICILFDTPYVTYKKLPRSPSCMKCKLLGGKNTYCKAFVDVNNRFYVNGYEYKNGEWKRTLKALWYLLF